MKTIDIKSLLVGILATSLIFTLISSKSIENDNINFVASPTGVGVFNKTTKMIYFYKVTFGSAGMQEKPHNSYKVAEDGSSVTKVE